MSDTEVSLPRLDHMFVASISEVSNNDLRVVVVEGRRNQTPTETEMGLAFPVKPDETCRAFRITWWGYVAYAVRNESYFRREEGEPDYRPLGVRTESAFLRYVAQTTFASDDYPGQLAHWVLYTEWHCIDVVSNIAPEVEEIPYAEIVWGLGERGGAG
jgi:hypothetical protein